MKVLILVSCALAVASAGYAPIGYYAGLQHYPVIDAHGHPVETPEVQAAKAHHFAAYGEALARNGHIYGHGYGAPALHNALPLDTPEVAAAKAQHYHDYAVAAHQNGVAVGHHGAAVGHLSGLPVDTPEVQLAKAAHFEAYAKAAHGAHYRKKRGLYAYAQHIPVIGPHGVPIETPEVQAAKAHHFAAHAEASARAHLGGYHNPTIYASAYPQHVPLISHNGVPLDTPEVAAAKSHHFAAHAEAAARNGHGHYTPLIYASPWAHGGAVIGHDGHPLETPEVQHAKAAHFAAHAAARGHHY